MANTTHRATVTGLHGWDQGATVSHQGTNALGAHSAIPVLTARRDREQTVHVAVHQLVPITDAAPSVPSDLRVDIDGTRLSVVWESEAVAVDVDLRTVVEWDEQPGLPDGR